MYRRGETPPRASAPQMEVRSECCRRIHRPWQRPLISDPLQVAWTRLLRSALAGLELQRVQPRLEQPMRAVAPRAPGRPVAERPLPAPAYQQEAVTETVTARLARV